MYVLDARMQSESLWIECQDEDWYIPGYGASRGLVCSVVSHWGYDPITLGSTNKRHSCK